MHPIGAFLRIVFRFITMLFREPRPASSIDRFIWSKGSKFLGYLGNGLALGMFITGGIQLLVSIGLAIGSIRGPIPAAVPIVNSAIAAVFIAIGIWATRRNAPEMKPEIKLSHQARKMMYRISNHIGWYDPEANGGISRNSWWYQIFGTKTASDVLTAEAAAYLDVACAEYNKLSALLEMDREQKGRAKSIAPQVQAAGMEAMIGILNQVAMLDANPEVRSTVDRSLQVQIHQLKELTARFDQMMTQPQRLSDTFVQSNLMDSVLGTLREENRAWEELHDVEQRS